MLDQHSIKFDFLSVFDQYLITVLSLFITIIAITSVLCTWGLFVVQHFECPPQCWFKICDMYCCGALFPIYCKCCLKDAVRAAEAVATGGLSNEASKLL